MRNIRMEQAARLLSEGKINVTQAAFNVGFGDQTYFSTVFKQYFGVSPTEYAKNPTHVEALSIRNETDLYPCIHASPRPALVGTYRRMGFGAIIMTATARHDVSSVSSVKLDMLPQLLVEGYQ